ncbi:OLC1v1013506C1 [Oldenlandia corymbosa var. corymbosa]|uniref:OLC1v1013506C1 n=1 Tax=Oldenlandia corymbosa var. corymbosa TaxID=529605 RepID=A0AAV1E1P5_OLDCO|nr:OLC1v1013506C1 [Oldenlandia corymbosa var. corymbosa]
MYDRCQQYFISFGNGSFASRHTDSAVLDIEPAPAVAAVQLADAVVEPPVPAVVPDDIAAGDVVPNAANVFPPPAPVGADDNVLPDGFAPGGAPPPLIADPDMDTWAVDFIASQPTLVVKNVDEVARLKMIADMYPGVNLPTFNICHGVLNLRYEEICFALHACGFSKSETLIITPTGSP